MNTLDQETRIELLAFRRCAIVGLALGFITAATVFLSIFFIFPLLCVLYCSLFFIYQQYQVNHTSWISFSRRYVLGMMTMFSTLQLALSSVVLTIPSAFLEGVQFLSVHDYFIQNITHYLHFPNFELFVLRGYLFDLSQVFSVIFRVMAIYDLVFIVCVIGFMLFILVQYSNMPTAVSEKDFRIQETYTLKNAFVLLLLIVLYVYAALYRGHELSEGLAAEMPAKYVIVSFFLRSVMSCFLYAGLGFITVIVMFHVRVAMSQENSQ